MIRFAPQAATPPAPARPAKAAASADGMAADGGGSAASRMLIPELDESPAEPRSKTAKPRAPKKQKATAPADALAAQLDLDA